MEINLRYIYSMILCPKDGKQKKCRFEKLETPAPTGSLLDA